MKLEAAWYGPRARLVWLWPLHLLMRLLVATRRLLYRMHILASQHPGVPVIVVGNITVGGTGKTPLALWLVEWLQGQGWKPGIVSRGYGGHAPRYPFLVTPDSLPAEVGDEPLLLRRRSGVPVVVDPNRSRGAAALRDAGCDVILCDDGLQHYALQRDLEIVVIDAVRQLGNGWLLPAGPLREMPSRLQSASLVISNGARIQGLAEHVMQLQPSACVNLKHGHSVDLTQFAGQRVHAVAGIGNPGRFFHTLRHAGIEVIEHPFPDHHGYQASDLPWHDVPVLMTEKDAVKCADFADDNHWFVAVRAQVNPEFAAALHSALQPFRKEVNHG